MPKDEPALPAEVEEVRQWMKDVPGLGVLVVVTWLAITPLSRASEALSEMGSLGQSSIAFVAALVLVCIGYYAGNFWDDRVFDPLYGFDPKRAFVGRWNNTTRRNCLGLLPAGDNLTRARQRAIKALLPPGSDGAGVYQAAERVLSQSGKPLGGRLPLSKMFRTLILPCILLSVGLLLRTIARSGGGAPLEQRWLGYAVGTLLLAGALFIPYLNLRVEHMISLYDRAGSEGRPTTG